MSVLIKGMEMPKNCDVCFMRDVCEYSMPLEKRLTDCPLIEVPPHGRLIDADALEYHAEIVRDTEDGHRWLVRAIEEDQILDAPTIIESEGE